MDDDVSLPMYGDDYEDFYDDDTVYWNDDDYQTAPSQQMNLKELYYICIEPTVSDSLPQIGRLLLTCFLFRIFVCLVPLPYVGIHLLSVISGSYVLNVFAKNKLSYVIILGCLAYSSLFIVQRTIRKQYGPFCATVSVLFLIICEIYVVESKEWHVIRGTQMLLTMKVISLGFDLDNRTITHFPNPIEFSGYCLCPGTLIFGPWICFRDYNKILIRSKITLAWIVRIAISGILAITFLILSTCICQWILHNFSNRWILAYRDALSFRTSHYFVSFIGETTALAVGYKAMQLNNWEFFVSQPQNTEIPRSLTEVVIFWNMPMHHWLKTYVFRMVKPLGTFAGIFSTYAASSLLHGLNFQLAAVLLSLGFYTYVEYMFRHKLANIFNACILARKCKSDCAHQFKQSHPFVILANMVFTLLTIFHLAYLGVMFDNNSAIQDEGYSMEHTLSKWSELSFASHWLVLGIFTAYLLI